MNMMNQMAQEKRKVSPLLNWWWWLWFSGFWRRLRCRGLRI